MTTRTIKDMLDAAAAHHAAGRLADAEMLCREILQVEQPVAATEHLLGTIALQSGHLEGAIGRFAKAIALDPDAAVYHRSLGRANVLLERYDEALRCYRAALALGSDQLAVDDAMPMLARHRPQEVLALYREASRQTPDDAGLLFQYANALFYADSPAEAVPVYRRVLAREPNNVGTLDNLALALGDLGRLDEAIACLERSVELSPQAPNAHNNLGLLLLLKGEYAAAWPHHEYGRPPVGNAAGRRWQGEALGGRRILLHAEQGFGDTLQFVRYAPMVAARGGEVVLQVQPPLARLLASVPGVAQVVMSAAEATDIACHCPMMSLPYVFGTEVATIPAAVPYLKAPPERRPWGQRIPRFVSRRVGLVWRGQPGHRRDRERSLPSDALAPLAGVAGVSFYSLQKPPPEGPLPPGLRLIDLSDGLDDFGDTAAALERLDLVVTVDTSLAHLAGALGKPVWVLLTHSPDWRWLMDRTDSPWYPTARLFRQPRPGDWASVLRQLADALSDWSRQ